MISRSLVAFAISLLISACATTPPAPSTPAPSWSPVSDANEAEYLPYLQPGTSTLRGQAFLTQAGGRVVTAAGRTVTLDPATTVGNEWWGKSAKVWVHRALTPPSPTFFKARRSTTADADGRFVFSDIPAGKYYVRTEVTWEVGRHNPTQGGLVGRLVDVRDGKPNEVILNSYPE